MSKKLSNRLFLVFILLDFVASGLVTLVYYYSGYSMGIIGSLLASQLLIFIPAILGLRLCKATIRDIPHGKLRLGVIPLCVIYTALCGPLITAVNLFSLLFVENTATTMATYFYSMPMWLILLLVGILGPMNEEFAFRGIIYGGYRGSGRFVAAMLLSSFLFGLMHLNLNQMLYAIVVGIMAVLLNEATGSIFASMLFHVCINSYNVILMWAEKDALLEAGGDAEAITTEALSMIGITYQQYILIAFLVCAILAVITTTLAALLLFGIAALQHRSREYKAFFIHNHTTHTADGETVDIQARQTEHMDDCADDGVGDTPAQESRRTKRNSLWSPTLIIAVILSLAYIIYCML